MQPAKQYPPLPERVGILIANSLLAYIVFIETSGELLPTGGLDSVWFLSALSLWFLSLLSAPWFVPPRDALATSIGATTILITMDLSHVVFFGAELDIIRWTSVGYAIAIAGLALSSLFLHDKDGRSPIAAFLFRLTAIFGRGEILLTPAALIGVLGAFQPNYGNVIWIEMFWILIVVGQPMERIAAAARQWELDDSTLRQTPSIGTIDRVDHPNILRVKLTNSSSWRDNRLHTASLPDGSQQYVVALFYQTQGSEVVGTGLVVAPANDSIELPSGQVCASHSEEKTASFIENLSGVSGAKLVGFVVENSTIGTIRFEVSVVSDIAEGDVVFTKVGGQDVFYQIIEAETSEENFDKNPRGTHIVRAVQLGCYSPHRGFTKFPWLPTMNSPLFAARDLNFPPPNLSDREFPVGTVPTVNVSVTANIDELVEYHSAILGITGTGKTELALDFVRQAIKRDVKVFCVDFTGDYRRRLADLNPVYPAPTPEAAADLDTKILAVDTGEYGAKKEKGILSVAIENLRAFASKQVDEFLKDEKSGLAIIELAEITNTKATLRLTELYLSSVMSWARAHRRARKVMIVLEEAHTIIPETFSSGFDADTQFVVSRIGQIALQGRKYGVGLMVVSQRTALVSKTILSQCNTFFTHALIDQTSLNFLESVYSSQHVKLIPNLGRFEFLAFGKALKSERPIMLRRAFDQAIKDASDALREPLPPAEIAQPEKPHDAERPVEAQPRIRATD